jgi:putative ABC transport system permease protein
MQFLIESVFVSGLGGLMGVILAFAGSDLIGQLLDTAITVETSVAAAAMIFSMAVGVIFGLYPAIKASKLNPIEALHYE